MKKDRNDYLISIASKVLAQNKSGLVSDAQKLEIKDYYNGQVAAFGVSVAMSGVIPTLANYYKVSGNNKDTRRPILHSIAEMICLDSASPIKINGANAESLVEFVIDQNNSSKIAALAIELEECSIALKQVIRTYNLV